MFYRKDAVFMAVAGLLATSGYAMAANTTGLSLDPSVLTADDAAQPAPLMALLGKAGMDKPLNDLKLNIYGWVESGYTYDHRHGTGSSHTVIAPGPFDHEYGDHYMLNQVDLRFERWVDTTKFDVGGLIELMYGSDAARIHSRGLGYSGSDSSDNNSPNDPLAVANLHPIWQFDITQAYVNVNLPIGNGLQVMVGKFVTLLGYETIDPRGNPFYSHSFIFNQEPFTHTGILGSYQFNDQWGMKLGISRGWDTATEDNNGAIDVIGQVSFNPNKQISVLLNYTVGPEDTNDTSHYRTAIDPVVTWQVTDAFKLGAEGIYIYDGGLNGDVGAGGTTSHAYGDVWGLAVYASYKINDYLTANTRLEKVHSYAASFYDTTGFTGSTSALGNLARAVPTINVYDITLGVTVTPMPKDPWLKGLAVRPEIRYDFSEDHVFTTNSHPFKDQLTFGADVIFQF